MASKEEKYKIINDLFQSIFKVTQNEKITGAADSEIKAMIGDGKWFIKVPGVCKIIIKQDQPEEIKHKSSSDEGGVPLDGEGNVGFNAPLHKPIKPEIQGDKFITDVAREYE